MAKQSGKELNTFNPLTDGELDFAAILERFLNEQGRNPAWLASRLNVRRSTVTRWLNRDISAPSSSETVLKIAEVLALSNEQTRVLLIKAGQHKLASTLKKEELETTKNQPETVVKSNQPNKGKAISLHVVEDDDRSLHSTARLAKFLQQVGFDDITIHVGRVIILILIALSLAAYGPRVIQLLRSIFNPSPAPKPIILPGPPTSAEDYYNRGVAYLDAKQFDLAIADFTKAIELDPKMAKAYDQRGSIYLDQDELGLVVADHLKLGELSPEKTVTEDDKRSQIVSVKTQQGAVAMRVITGTLDSKTSGWFDPKKMVFKPGYEVEVNREGYTETLQLDPATYHVARATAYISEGKTDLALEEFNTAIELNSNPAFAYGKRGDFFFSQHNYFPAVQDYTKLIGAATDTRDILEAYIQRGRAYFYSGAQEMAMSDFTQALAIDANFSEGHFAICLFGIFMNQVPEVVKHCHQAVEIEQQQYYRDARAIALAISGNYQGALEDLWAYKIGETKEAFAHSWRGALVSALSENKNPFNEEVITRLNINLSNKDSISGLSDLLSEQVTTDAAPNIPPIGPCPTGKKKSTLGNFGYARVICID